jgi:hypothetical protein
MKENIETITRLSTSKLIAVLFAFVYFIVAFTGTPEIFLFVFSVLPAITTFIGFYSLFVVSDAKSVKIHNNMN